MVGAIAAGNAVILKPSEMAPNTALLINQLVTRYVADSSSRWQKQHTVLCIIFYRYMDKSLIKVVEGGIQETEALLSQKFDYIFFTGEISFCFLSTTFPTLNVIIL